VNPEAVAEMLGAMTRMCQVILILTTNFFCAASYADCMIPNFAGDTPAPSFGAAGTPDTTVQCDSADRELASSPYERFTT
jgi:hypothetical protein